MSTSIPSGALLVLTQHFSDVVQSAGSNFPTIQVEGKTAQQDESLHCDAYTDGSFEIHDKWFGHALDVAVKPTTDGMTFRSVGGDLPVDLVAKRDGYNFDLRGSIDKCPIEYHFVVHAGLNEHGHIGDVAFNYNRWAAPHAVQLKGALGDKPIMELIVNDDKPHPESCYIQHWNGACGDVEVDETVTHTASLVPAKK